MSKQDTNTDRIFKLFAELCLPKRSVSQRELTFHRIFTELMEKENLGGHLDVLDIFSSVLASKPQIFHGCSNILDLVMVLIESNSLSPSSNGSVTPQDHNTTKLCKLFHILDIVGRSSLTVKAYTRLLLILKKACQKVYRPLLASLVVASLVDMARHSIRADDAANFSGKIIEPKCWFWLNGGDCEGLMSVDRPSTLGMKGNTIALWIKWSKALQTGDHVLFSMRNVCSGISFRLSGAFGTPSVVIHKGNKKQIEHVHYFNKKIPPCEWHLVAFTHRRAIGPMSKDELAYYLWNGKEMSVERAYIPYPGADASDKISVGWDPFRKKKSAFHGCIGLCAMFRVALRSSALQEFYTLGPNYECRPSLDGSKGWLSSLRDTFNPFSPSKGAQNRILQNTIFVYQPSSVIDS
jgi:hypothetical protein